MSFNRRQKLMIFILLFIIVLSVSFMPANVFARAGGGGGGKTLHHVSEGVKEEEIAVTR